MNKNCKKIEIKPSKENGKGYILPLKFLLNNGFYFSDI